MSAVRCLVGRCSCGRPGARLVGETPYCTGCLPSGMLRFSEHQRIFRLLTSNGVSRATASVMMIARLDFERGQGLEFDPND